MQCRESTAHENGTTGTTLLKRKMSTNSSEMHELLWAVAGVNVVVVVVAGVAGVAGGGGGGGGSCCCCCSRRRSSRSSSSSSSSICVRTTEDNIQ